jgi:ABC-type sugar transport system ATPase subunit
MSNIEFRSVTKTYRNGRVINALSFAIEAGERIVLFGRSGCGSNLIILESEIPPCALASATRCCSPPESAGPNIQIVAERYKVRHVAIAPLESRILLMDEPLSNLDAALGGRLRREILLLHAELALTLVYVTHSCDEAREIGTRTIELSVARGQ